MALALLLGFMSAKGYEQNVAGLRRGISYPSYSKQQLLNYTSLLTRTGSIMGPTTQTVTNAQREPGNGSPYQATPTFQNLTPGTCLVSVKDSIGRSTGQSVRLDTSALPTIDALKTVAPRCGLTTGSISLTASGGTGILTYSIDSTTYQREPIFQNLAGGNYTVRVRDARGYVATQAVALPTSFSVGITRIASTSAGCGQPGSLTLTTTGGSGAIEHSIDGKTYQPGTVVSGLRGGNYTVQIRDGAGCSATQSANVAGNSGPVIDSLLATAPKCLTANGTLTVLASGGTGALVYSIDESTYQVTPQFGNLSGGRYMLRVRDATGCQASKQGTLAPSVPFLIVSVDVKPTTCGLANGQASMTVTGGDGPIRFSTDGRRAQASSRFDSLQAGTYQLFAQDSAGCTAGQSVSIAASTLPVIVDVATTAEACGEKNATITIATAEPAGQYTFAINGGSFQPDSTFTGLAGGRYTVAVRDIHACVSTQSVSLAVDCADAVHLPSAFSPNADNRNDVLASFFSFPSLNVVRFVVYDRWGGVLYSRTNFALTNGEPIWDGQLGDGRQVAAGVYSYRLDCRFPDGSGSTYQKLVTVVK